MAVIPSCVTNEFTGMETKLHSFLMSTLDVVIEVPETEDVYLPSCHRQLFWLYLWKPFPCEVCRVTGYGLEGPGIESRCGTRFCAPAKTVLGPTQHHIQWLPGLSGGGVKRPERGVDHPSHLAPKLKTEYSYNYTPILSLLDCSRVKFTPIASRCLQNRHHLIRQKL